jgi:hypothetical protein
MVTYYVIPIVSPVFNYLRHHLFCLGGRQVTTYVTSSIPSLIGESPISFCEHSSISW